MIWVFRFFRYLPLIIDIGYRVVKLVGDVEKARETKRALAAAKTGNTEPLKTIVSGLK